MGKRSSCYTSQTLNKFLKIIVSYSVSGTTGLRWVFMRNIGVCQKTSESPRMAKEYRRHLVALEAEVEAGTEKALPASQDPSLLWSKNKHSDLQTISENPFFRGRNRNKLPWPQDTAKTQRCCRKGRCKIPFHLGEGRRRFWSPNGRVLVRKRVLLLLEEEQETPTQDQVQRRGRSSCHRDGRECLKQGSSAFEVQVQDLLWYCL